MTDTHHTTTTETTHDDIYDLMRNLLRENPDLNERKLIRKWRNQVRDDTDMIEGALDLAGLYVYNAVLPEKKRRRKNKEKLRRSRKQQVSRMFFSVLMPNGKPLGDCTFGEVGKFGEDMCDWRRWENRTKSYATNSLSRRRERRCRDE